MNEPTSPVTSTSPANAIGFRWALAHRDSRIRGPRPLTSWALFKVHDEWRGLTADDPENAPAALKELADALNALDGTVTWTDFEAAHAHVIEHDPDQVTGDFSTGVRLMSRAIEVRRHVGGIMGDGSLARECPNLHKLLNDRLPARKLLPEQEAEIERRAAEQAAAERKERLEREDFEEIVSDALESLDTTDRRRALALINVAFRVRTHEDPEKLAKLLLEGDYLTAELSH